MGELAPLVALVGALVLVALAMPAGVGWLRRLHLLQVVRRQGPAAHLVKEGTPTAAGVLLVPAACLVAWAVAPRDLAVLVCLAVAAGHGALGFADDWLKVVRRRPGGLWARHKLAGQLLLGLLLAGFALAERPESVVAAVPFLRPHLLLPPLAFVVLTLAAVLGSTNGTNFTDGADGLLGSTGAVALGALGALLWVEGHLGLAAVELAFAGALVGFLRWNWHPARVFMGDTGSMAVGAAFAAGGVLGGLTLYLPLLGFFFLLEVVSVMVQVAWYRRTGRRFLRMAPLHHHLELSGWGERLLVPRVLAFTAACSAFGLLAYWR